MACARLRVDERPQALVEARVLCSWAEKLKGLLGTGPGAGTVMLTKCSSVHTFGMGYALDLAFVGEQGEVLKALLSVGPGRVASCAGAACVLERPSAAGPWLAEGEHLWVCGVSAETL